MKQAKLSIMVFQNRGNYKVVKIIYMKSISLLFMVVLMGFLNSAKADNGKEIYINNCLVCHGEYLHGDMPGMPDLFINRAWIKKLDSKIHKFVKEGTEASGNVVVMPAKGGDPHLSDEEIKSAVQYMREIIKKDHRN